MDMAERNAADFARTLGEIVTGTSAMDSRVRALESIQQDRRVSDVERTSREQAMQKDIASIQTDVSSIKAGINRVLWAVALGVLAAFIGFVLRGGLNG